jgi:hypothetical protein
VEGLGEIDSVIVWEAIRGDLLWENGRSSGSATTGSVTASKRQRVMSS